MREPLRTIPGTVIHEPPILDKYELIETLLEFDGPLVCLYQQSCASDDLILVVWCDCDDVANRWMVIPVHFPQNRDSAIEVLKSLRGRGPVRVQFVDFDTNCVAVRQSSAWSTEIPDDYLPIAQYWA
jgi:hypothetical protein